MNKRKTTIFFRAIGNNTFGMGHIYRSLSLATAIKKNKHAYSIVFILKKNEQALKQLIEDKGFNTHYLENIQPTEQSLLIYDMPCLETDIISEKYLFTRILGLDYFYQNVIDKSLNLFTHNKHQHFPYEVKEGIRFALLNQNILATEKAFSISNQQVKHLLITFGSLDPQNNTLKTLNKLKDFAENITVILGPLYAHQASLMLFIKENASLKVTLIQSPQGIGDYINSADIVFCGGGTTLLESIYLAKPAIVLSQTDAELTFAKHLEEQGLCSINRNDLPSFTEREIMRKKCLQTSIGNGAQLIIKNIEELLSA